MTREDSKKESTMSALNFVVSPLSRNPMFSPVGKNSQNRPQQKVAGSMNKHEKSNKNHFHYTHIVGSGSETNNNGDIESLNDVEIIGVDRGSNDVTSPMKDQNMQDGSHDELLPLPRKHVELRQATCYFFLLCTVLIHFLLIIFYDFPAQKQAGCSSELQQPLVDEGVKWNDFQVNSSKGIVATDNALCSQIGADVLTQGGNAIDAAVASALCLGVLSPASSGIGGGCFILIHNASTGYNTFIDSREMAPQKSTSNMFVSNPIEAQDGGKAVAVLAELQGLYHAWAAHGSGAMSWDSLVSPAATLAEEFTISPELARYIPEVESQLKSGKYPGLSELFLREDGVTLKSAGDIVLNPKLANTLRMIGSFGPDYIYDHMAATLAAEIQETGGIITEEDIRAYAPRVMEGLRTTVFGHDYIGAPSSSSGGAVVSGILKFLASYANPLANQGLLYLHRLAEAMKHCFAIRLSLGDPNFFDTFDAVHALMNDSFMAALQKSTSDTTVLPLDAYGGRFGLKDSTRDAGTSHLSIVDKFGNAVALTSTINTYFGSKVVSNSTGILLNNEMDDFSVPNVSNYFGLAPSSMNFPEPFKRPLSSMSPSLVLLNGRVRLVGGASGGPKIITATAQIILNCIGFGMNLLDAFKQPRIHSQLLPDVLYVENHTTVSGLKIQTPMETYAYLRSTGHVIDDAPHSMGVAQFIEVDPITGLMTAVSDVRKDGRPAAAT